MSARLSAFALAIAAIVFLWGRGGTPSARSIVPTAEQRREQTEHETFLDATHYAARDALNEQQTRELQETINQLNAEVRSLRTARTADLHAFALEKIGRGEYLPVGSGENFRPGTSGVFTVALVHEGLTKVVEVQPGESQGVDELDAQLRAHIEYGKSVIRRFLDESKK